MSNSGTSNVIIDRPDRPGLLESWDQPRVFCQKGWGWEDHISNSPLYCCKKLFVKKKKRLSLHYHNLKTETFYVQSGYIEIVVYDDPLIDDLFTSWDDFEHYKKAVEAGISRVFEVVCLQPGETYFIPTGRRHTVRGLLDTEIFEASTQHFDSDSIRVLKGD